MPSPVWNPGLPSGPRLSINLSRPPCIPEDISLNLDSAWTSFFLAFCSLHSGDIDLTLFSLPYHQANACLTSGLSGLMRKLV